MRRVRFAVLRWSNVDKCLLVSAILWQAGVAFGLCATFAGAWPYLPPGQPDELLAELSTVAWWIVLGWTALLGLGVLLRKRAPENRVIVFAVITFYSVVTAMFSYAAPWASAPDWSTY